MTIKVKVLSIKLLHFVILGHLRNLYSTRLVEGSAYKKEVLGFHTGKCSQSQAEDRSAFLECRAN